MRINGPETSQGAKVALVNSRSDHAATVIIQRTRGIVYKYI